MPAGKRSQSPAELIANKQFPTLLNAMFEQFERVIIDSAPVHAVSDTLIISKYMDVTCLVVHSASTPVDIVQTALHKLSRSNAKVAGFILNRVMESSSYYYYGGGGSYGKGVYGAPQSEHA